MGKSNERQSTDDSASKGTWPQRVARNLRNRLELGGHGAHHYFLRGVSYSLGTGAVSLIIVWVQSRF